MALPEKKIESGQKGPILGGETSLSRLKEKLTEATPRKEEKKDTSAFGKNGYLPHHESRELLKESKKRLFEKYNLRGSDVDRLSEEITDYKKYHSFTDPEDIKNFEKYRNKEIKNIPNLSERDKARKALEKKVKALKDVFLGEK